MGCLAGRFLLFLALAALSLHDAAASTEGQTSSFALSEEVKHSISFATSANATSTEEDVEYHSAAKFLRTVLREADYQQVITVVVGVVGLLSVVDAMGFGRLTIVFTIACAGGTVASFEAGQTFGESLGSFWGPLCVGLEGALFFGFAAIAGFKGFRFVVGGGFGMLACRVVRNYGLCKIREDDIVWYSVCAIVGSAVLALGEDNALAVFGSIVGGLLVSSSIAFYAGEAAGDGYPWIDFLFAMLGYEEKSNVFKGDTTARYICLGVWAFVALIGMVRFFNGWSSSMFPWTTTNQEDEEMQSGYRSDPYQMQQGLLPEAPKAYAPPPMRGPPPAGGTVRRSYMQRGRDYMSRR